MKYLLVIDAGTGSVRSVIFDTLGAQISIHQIEWEHKQLKKVPNSMNFDFDHNWQLVIKCIKKSISKANIDPKDILAVTASSMREGIVLYDKKGNELFAVANVDARATQEVKYLNQQYPALEQEFYEKSGQTFALAALPRLLWVKNNLPKVYEKTSSISMISDWVLAKLSNIIATDPSNGGTTGIFSLKKRDWIPSMASKIGIKSNIFPPCYESGTIIGNITKEVSTLTGLCTKTKVVTGGGDVQLGTLGLGITKPYEVAILGGSFWQQIVNIPSNTQLPKNRDLRINPHVVPNLSQAEGITFFSGLVMRWFRDVFCQEEIKEAQALNTDPYTLLEQKSVSIPVGSYGIIPIFSDTMKYNKWYHASPSFLNLSIDPTYCNKYSMFKSLQENACIVSYLNLKKIEKFTKTKFDQITFASGASKGEQWCQILADVTNCTIKVPVVKEATSLGGAIVAATAVGVYKNFDEAVKQLVQFEKTYKPNKKNHKKYKKIAKNWEKVYNAQLKLVDKNLTQSMWKAPGL
ncbi:MAG: autoinducer-2 kinase [Campylobacterales bacterium]|nr:autoinducer-2 kinase [Campylobacterales bacterium]